MRKGGNLEPSFLPLGIIGDVIMEFDTRVTMDGVVVDRE